MSTVMCYKVRRLPHTNPLVPRNYPYLRFLPCSPVSQLSFFFWNLLFSIFYFNELAFYE